MKIRLGDFVQHHRKLKRADARQRLGELIDRVVVARHRRVAAAIRRRHREVRRDLLGGADGVDERLAVAQRAAAAFVERVRGVDQLLVIREQPANAVRSAALFVRRQREDDVAIGDVASPA